MLIAAFIFVMSIATALQFGVWSWRAGLLRVAALEPGLTVQNNPITHILLESQDFPEIMGYRKLCPQLGNEGGLRCVSAYYRFLKILSALGDVLLPSGLRSWPGREMALCTRYATVVMVQRLEQNQVLAAQARSY